MSRIFLFIMLSAQISYAFDKDLCSDLFHIAGGDSLYSGIGFVFSSQYTSSTGKCSSTREAKINKITSYVLVNREQLKNDFARNAVDTINSFVQVCACNEPGQSYVTKYFLPDLKTQIISDLNREQLKTYLETVFRSDKTLYYGCLVYDAK